jgi:hypothetical protein
MSVVGSLVSKMTAITPPLMKGSGTCLLISGIMLAAMSKQINGCCRYLQRLTRLHY